MTVKIMVGDVREKLRELPDGSVHCCVTSPPYWGLRDYGHDGQIGLERTPDEFVAKLVEVFREVRRVLRDDGTLWVNIGDSYAGYWGDKYAHKPFGADRTPDASTPPHKKSPNFKAWNVKPKDLVGVPWLLAFALRADGWFLRQDIIWSKPNPMPESVLDRCTKAHEYIFLLSKSERYFYDAAAIAEPTVIPPESACNSFARDEKPGAVPPGNNPQKRASRVSVARGGFDGKTNALVGREAFRAVRAKRNKRSVWTITTKPYRGAHFATFPPELPEICIKAGTSEKGVCPHCAAPWVRTVETQRVMRHELPEDNPNYRPGRYTRKAGGNDEYANGGGQAFSVKTGEAWSQSCDCQSHTPVHAVVLDPFGGAGTTGLVADRLQRNAILIELNPVYAEMARKRIHGDAPLFAEVA